MKQDKNIHPSCKHILKYFAYKHLPPHLQAISKPFAALAHLMVSEIPNSPEVTVGLRKLLEAKDCFVRGGLPSNDETI